MMLEAVTGTLRHRRSEGWFVGGTVRDRESGRHSPDLDLVVTDDPAAVAREIAQRLTSPWFALSTRHGAYRVMGHKGHVDVAGIRGTGILDDLAQRDFTINAMAIPVEGGDLVDPFGGRVHLREKRLVAVSEGVFVDDPLRLMRAARFCHVLGLRLDPQLETLLRLQAPDLARAAPERVAAEMNLALAWSPSASAVRLWDDLGLLEHMFPELTASGHLMLERGARGSAAGSTTIEAVLERLDHALVNLPSWFPQTAPVILERLACPVDGAWMRTVALRLAAMTHGLSPEGASSAARRLRLSAALLSLLKSVSVCFQQRQCSPEALRAAAQSPRAAVLFLWGSAPWEAETILLASCAAGPPLDAVTPDLLPAPEVLDPARRLMALWAHRSAGAPPNPPVDGDVLMRELNLSPGPQLGEILRAVRLAWEAGEVTTAGEAMELAKSLLKVS